MGNLDVVTKSFTVRDVRLPFMPSAQQEPVLGGMPASMRGGTPAKRKDRVADTPHLAR